MTKPIYGDGLEDESMPEPMTVNQENIDLRLMNQKLIDSGAAMEKEIQSLRQKIERLKGYYDKALSALEGGDA